MFLSQPTGFFSLFSDSSPFFLIPVLAGLAGEELCGPWLLAEVKFIYWSAAKLKSVCLKQLRICIHTDTSVFLGPAVSAHGDKRILHISKHSIHKYWRYCCTPAHYWNIANTAEFWFRQSSQTSKDFHLSYPRLRNHTISSTYFSTSVTFLSHQFPLFSLLYTSPSLTTDLTTKNSKSQ